MEKVKTHSICRISAKRNERTKELLHIESMFAPYKKIVLIKTYQKHVEERMGDHREELLVRSRETYLLIYNADRNKCSACTSTNWKLAPFKFQTKPLASWMSDRRQKSITAERRTQSLTGRAGHPQRKKSFYVPLAVRGKNILRVRSVRTSHWPAEIGGR